MKVQKDKVGANRKSLFPSNDEFSLTLRHRATGMPFANRGPAMGNVSEAPLLFAEFRLDRES